MRPSAACLVRIIPRNALKVPDQKVIPQPAPQTQELKKPTLIHLLMQRKADAGTDWPANLRIEPVVKKEAFKRVNADVRKRLKCLLKER
jgi:hypothetical protein